MTVQQEHGATTRLGGSLLARRRRTPDRRLRGRRQRRDPVHLGLAADRRRLLRLSRSRPSTGPSGTAPPSCARSTRTATTWRGRRSPSQRPTNSIVPQRLPDGTSVFAPAQGARRQSPPRDRAHDRERHPRGGLDAPDDRRRHLFRLQPRERLPPGRIRADRADGGRARERRESDAPLRPGHARGRHGRAALRGRKLRASQAGRRVRPRRGPPRALPARPPARARRRLRPGRAGAPARDARHDAARARTPARSPSTSARASCPARSGTGACGGRPFHVPRSDKRNWRGPIPTAASCLSTAVARFAREVDRPSWAREG